MVHRPVCAPARTAIITGMYPQSTGGEHMRSLVRLPAGMRFFPALLRDAGYYTTNNSKQDYNVMEAGDGRSPPTWRQGSGAAALDVQTDGVWDDSSPTAHWRNRRPGQPFFAVFNIMETHESSSTASPRPRCTIRPRCACRRPCPTFRRCGPTGRRITTT